MGFYKFIKIKGPGCGNIGYFVPRMFKLPFMWSELRIVGLQFVLDRLAGWTVWWVRNEEEFTTAIKTLKELRKTRVFDYKVSNW